MWSLYSEPPNCRVFCVGHPVQYACRVHLLAYRPTSHPIVEKCIYSAVAYKCIQEPGLEVLLRKASFQCYIDLTIIRCTELKHGFRKIFYPSDGVMQTQLLVRSQCNQQQTRPPRLGRSFGFHNSCDFRGVKPRTQNAMDDF